MNRFVKYSILIIVLLSQSAFSNGRITSGFEFLRLDFSPRTAAMSRAFTTIRADVNGMFTNPAGLSYLESDQFTLNYTNYVLDISGGLAAYARHFEGIGMLSFGITYMDYGDFEETTETAEKTGNTFGANDLAIGVGLSNRLDQHFSYGVNLKYAFSKLQDYNASAIALDFGLIYDAPFQDDLHFAITLLNLGTNFKYYQDTQEPLPLSLNIGLSKKLAHLPLEIALSLKDLNVERNEMLDYIKGFSIGGEFRFSESFRARIGYDNQLHSGLETTKEERFGGLSGGVGIYWGQFRLDYAYSNFSSLGSIHRLGIQGSL